MGKWEYQILQMAQDQTLNDAVRELDKLGEDGWELVSLYAYYNDHRFVFKRPTKAPVKEKGMV